MLTLIEQRVTAKLGDALAARNHLTIATAPGPADPLAAGKGRIIVALDTVTAEAVFPRDELAVVQKTPPLVRRVLPLHFTLAVRLRLRPNNDVDAARALLLDDLALTMHALGDSEKRDGTAFAPQPNDGFDILAFALDSGKVQADLVDGIIAADLQYRGTAEIWPREAPKSADAVKVVDRHLAAQKADITATPSRVATEGTSRIVVRSLDPKRLVKDDGTTAPLQVAAHVVSDLPPEKRGRITNGVDGVGARLIEVDAGKRQAVIAYTAPKAPLGNVAVEFVAVHFARSDGSAGALIGTAAVALVEVKP